MEEVDGIILRRLTDIGCELPDDAKSIKAISPSDFVESIVRCLQLINPDVQLGGSKLPANVAARFRFATALAESITALGFKGNIGYQMILYGSETDVRRVLMFLIEKLPKEGAVSTAVTAVSVAAERLRRELHGSGAPWFGKTIESDVKSLYWRPPYPDGDVSFQTDDFSMERDLATNLRAFRHVPASVLALNTVLFSAGKSIDLSPGIHEDIGLVLHAEQIAASSSSLAASGVKRIKPPIAPKPSALKTVPVEKTVNVKQEDELHETAAEEMQKRMESLTIDLNAIDQEYEQKTKQLSDLEEMLARICNSIRKAEERLPSKQADVNQRRLMAELAPNADEHVKQLQDYLSKSDARLEKLAATKDDLCAPFHREIAEIKSTSHIKPESERLADEIETMERKATETSEEMQAKKGQLQALQREYDRMEKDINRAYYTKRILEIVANVNKQKQEIARVLDDIRVVQKDINMLSGKLDRSFTAGDELMYKDAMRDDFIKRAYKCFVSLHEFCANIVSHIENAGHLEREMRDLDDQIETESQRSVEATLEALVSDFCEMKQANEEIFAKLRQLGIKV